MNKQIRCVTHGSFGKHLAEIQRVAELFRSVGIQVLAPKIGELSSGMNGFALFDDEFDKDPRLIELEYLHKLKRLGTNGFSYFVNLDGYIGKSASYELGIAQLTNVRCFYAEKLADHPAYVHRNAVWSPGNLAEYISKHSALPTEMTHINEKQIHRLWQELMHPAQLLLLARSLSEMSKIKKKYYS